MPVIIGVARSALLGAAIGGGIKALSAWISCADPNEILEAFREGAFYGSIGGGTGYLAGMGLSVVAPWLPGWMAGAITGGTADAFAEYFTTGEITPFNVFIGVVTGGLFGHFGGKPLKMRGPGSAFNPSSKTGISLQTQIGPAVRGKRSVLVSSNNIFGIGDEIITSTRPGPEGAHHILRGTFDDATGQLRVNWYSTSQPGRGIGTELLSDAIQGVGPSNVTNLSGQLGAVNRTVYQQLRLKGFSATDAAWGSPLGRSARKLGFTELEFDSRSLEAIFSF